MCILCLATVARLATWARRHARVSRCSCDICLHLMTMMSVRAQTMRWSAPEVLRGEPHTTEADVWSFGVVMWEIYTDALTPFESSELSFDVTRAESTDVLQLRSASCRRTLRATTDWRSQKSALSTCIRTCCRAGRRTLSCALYVDDIEDGAHRVRLRTDV